MGDPPFKCVRTARQLGELLGEPPPQCAQNGGELWGEPPSFSACEERGVGEVLGDPPSHTVRSARDW